MSAGDLPGQGQAQTRSLNAAVQRIMRAIELFENLFRTLPGHAHSAIFDFDLHVRQGTVLPGNFQSDFLAAVRVFFRIREQVDNDLCQRVVISVYQNLQFGDLAFDLKSVGFELRTITLKRLTNDLDEITFFELIFLFATVHAGKIENVVYKPSETGRFRRDDVEIGALAFRIGDAAFREQFRKHTN